jgi:hypothetical protein
LAFAVEAVSPVAGGPDAPAPEVSVAGAFRFPFSRLLNVALRVAPFQPDQTRMPPTAVTVTYVPETFPAMVHCPLLGSGPGELAYQGELADLGGEDDADDDTGNEALPGDVEWEVHEESFLRPRRTVRRRR